MRGKRWGKRLLAGVAALLGAIMLWAGGALAYVVIGCEADDAAPADVILVLGCPSYEGNIPATAFSACIQARARHAAALYRRDLAGHIITTGGLTGPPPSEAGALAAVLQGEGVPPEAIVLEERARDTMQNVRYSRALMQARGWRTAILVTEPHHIRRAALIARDAGLTITVSPAVDSAGWHTPEARRINLLRDAQALMAYQLSRGLAAIGRNPE